MAPFVSIIVPVLNRKALLQELLNSMERLQYPNDRFEVLIVDNGSTDGTWELLESYVRCAPFQVRLLRNTSSNRIPSASRNIGIAAARGDLLAFTDSDCLVTPDWLREGASGFEEGVAIVHGLTVPHDAEERPVLHHTIATNPGSSYGETCNIFYRRDAVEHVGGFDESLTSLGREAVWGEDTDLAYRVKALGYRMVFRENALVVHHIVPKSFRSWLLEPFRVWPWPKVVKRHPLIREELLFARIFYNRTTALFDLLMLGVLLAVILHPLSLVLAAPFLVAKYLDGGALKGPARFARVIGGTIRAFFLCCTLFLSSARHRALIL